MILYAVLEESNARKELKMTREFLKGLGIEDADVISKVLDEAQKEKTPLKTEIAQLKEDVIVKDNLIKGKNDKIKD